jgi:hypothetical protein
MMSAIRGLGSAIKHSSSTLGRNRIADSAKSKRDSGKTTASLTVCGENGILIRGFRNYRQHTDFRR